MAKSMIDKKDSANFLMQIVKDERLNRMSQFEQLKNSNEELTDFPRHSLEALKNKIKFGSYQMSFCLSYLSEQFVQKGWYCECKNGARTLGCCCHIASVI